MNTASRYRMMSQPPEPSRFSKPRVNNPRLSNPRLNVTATPTQHKLSRKSVAPTSTAAAKLESSSSSSNLLPSVLSWGNRPAPGEHLSTDKKPASTSAEDSKGDAAAHIAANDHKGTARNASGTGQENSSNLKFILRESLLPPEFAHYKFKHAMNSMTRVPQFGRLKDLQLFLAIRYLPRWQQCQELSPWFGPMDV
jgi:hypothetical protein